MVDASGNVYVSGAFSSDYIRFGTDSVALVGYYDIFLVKYNSAGVFQWLKTAGDTDDDESFGQATDAAGNTYLTGYIGYGSTVAFGTHSITNNSQSLTMFVAKYDNTGTAQWARISQGDDGTYNKGTQVRLDAAGNPNVIGSYTSDSLNMGAVSIYNSSLNIGGGDDSSDVFVAKYKTNGSLSWARSAGNTGNDEGNGIALGLNNSLYITGEYSSPTISFGGITFTITPGSQGGTGDAFIASNIATSTLTPSICMVTADSLSINNIVYWDKTDYTNAAYFIIYRETSSGVYTKIGSQPFSAFSEFIDTARSISPVNGDPNKTSYRYKLQILDTSGNYSLLSPYHNTMFMTQGLNGSFSWSPNYSIEGQTVSPVSNYVLSCDTLDTGIWTVVATQTGSQTTMVDLGFIHHSNTANWRVDAEGFTCNPTFRLNGNNTSDASKVRSHSNQSNNRAAGITKVSGNNYQVLVYPNPNQGNFTIETGSTEKQMLQVFDVSGKLVLSQTITNKTVIDGAALSEGVYTINVIGNEGVANKRMVIVK